MPTKPILRRGICPHCRQSVLWGLLQNGYWRTFQESFQPPEEVAERDRFAVSRRLNRVVDVPGTHVPDQVLTPHYCAAYAETKLMRGVVGVGQLVDSLPISSTSGGTA